MVLSYRSWFYGTAHRPAEASGPLIDVSMKFPLLSRFPLAAARLQRLEDGNRIRNGVLPLLLGGLFMLGAIPIYGVSLCDLQMAWRQAVSATIKELRIH